jgi:hypothetical protein
MTLGTALDWVRRHAARLGRVAREAEERSVNGR